MNFFKAITACTLSVLMLTSSAFTAHAHKQHKPSCPKAHKHKSSSSCSSSDESRCDVGCCKCTIITCLPFTITKSGKYAIAKDLFYNNLDANHVGIEVQADDVEIDLCRHSITIGSGSPGTIIRMTNHENLFVHNGTLEGAGPVTNNQATDLSGITLQGVRSVKVDDIFFQDLRQGITLSSGFQNFMLTLTNSNFNNIFSRAPVSQADFESLKFAGGGIVGFKLRGLYIDNCQFKWNEDGGPSPNTASTAVLMGGFLPPVDGEIFDVIVRNCNLINNTGGFFLFPAGNTQGSFIFEDCNFLFSSQAQALSFFTGITVSTPDANSAGHSIRISGCNFTAIEPICFERTGISIPSGHSVLIEKCTFSIPNIVQFGATSGHSIVTGISNPGSIVDNIIIRECVFSGTSPAPQNAPSVLRHIGLFKTRAALIEECQFSDACVDAILISVFNPNDNVNTQATIRNNVFSQNPGTAVHIDDNIFGTTLQGNIFRQNGIGVALDANTIQTVIADNIFHFNKVHIAIDPTSQNNTIVNNLQTDTDPNLPGCQLPGCNGAASASNANKNASLPKKK